MFLRIFPHFDVSKRHVTTHHVPPGEEAGSSLPPSNDPRLLHCLLSFRPGKRCSLFARSGGSGPWSFLFPPVTSPPQCGPFFWPPLQLFPRHYLTQPLLKLTRYYFWISMSLLPQVRKTYVDFFPPPVVSQDGKCFCCPSWTKWSVRLKELLCAEMSGVTAGQRLGQRQPTLGARVFFFLECVSKCGSGQSKPGK